MQTDTQTQENETDTTRDTPEAPGLDGEPLSLDLKEFGLDGLEPAETPAPEKDERSERSDARSDARSEAPDARRPKGDLRKALHEERAAKREANQRAEHYRQIAEEVSKRTASHDPGLNLRGTVPEVAAPKLSAEQKQQLYAAVEQAASLGKSTEAVIDVVEKMFEGHAAATKQAIHEHVVGLERTFRERETLRLERAFARDYPDYGDTVRRSGIGELIAVDPRTGQPGPRYNPRIAQEIAQAENPVEAAYFIAKGLLGDHRPSASGRDESPSPSDDLSTDRPTDRRPAATDRPASAERRPAPGSERVDHGARPRSVRDLPPAGAPQGVRMDASFKAHLDQQWKKNPEGVMKLFAQRPDIQRWYEDG